MRLVAGAWPTELAAAAVAALPAPVALETFAAVCERAELVKAAADAARRAGS